MIRKLFTIILLLTLCHAPAWAQTDDDFVPTLPKEPGQFAKLTLTVSPEGAGTVSGGGTYDVGVRKYLTTSASDTKWKFVRWKNADTGATVSSYSNFYYTTVAGATHLVAEYEEQTLTPLVLLKNPEDADVSLSGSGSYYQGRSVYVYAYSSSHYKFVNWTNKRTGKVVSTNYWYYFTKTAEPDTLIANYEFSPNTPSEPTPPVIVVKPDEPTILYHNVNVDVNIAEGGTVKTSNTSVAEGAQYTVTATPKNLYEFIGWQVDDKIVSTASSYTTTMGTSDIKLTAMFQFAPSRPDEPEMAEEQPEPEPDPEPEPEPEPEPLEPSTILGDVNGDYRVNIIDLTMINGYILGREVEGFVFSNADINKDGRVNALDVALLIARLIINV